MAGLVVGVCVRCTAKLGFFVFSSLKERERTSLCFSADGRNTCCCYCRRCCRCCRHRLTQSKLCELNLRARSLSIRVAICGHSNKERGSCRLGQFRIAQHFVIDSSVIQGGLLSERLMCWADVDGLGLGDRRSVKSG